jgi:hypothetical protein
LAGYGNAEETSGARQNVERTLIFALPGKSKNRNSHGSENEHDYHAGASQRYGTGGELVEVQARGTGGPGPAELVPDHGDNGGMTVNSIRAKQECLAHIK